MALKIGPINGHTVMLDSVSDPEMIWIMCSCGAVMNVPEPPSGAALKMSIERISKHLGEDIVNPESMEEKMALFDAIFPPEE